MKVSIDCLKNPIKSPLLEIQRDLVCLKKIPHHINLNDQIVIYP